MAREKGKLKLSKAAREDLTAILDTLLEKRTSGRNAGKSQLEEWIVKVAKKNPARAAELALALAEYSVPKLARVENTGPDGGPMRVVVKTLAARPQAKPEEGT